MSQSTKSAEIQEELDYRAAIADCFLDLSETCILNRDYDAAVKYINLAILLFLPQNRDLSNPRIEANLRALAKVISEDKSMEGANCEPVSAGDKPVCLHVFKETLAFGGHTALAKRWIELDGDARTHSIVILANQTPPPAELVQAVTRSGGKIYSPDQKSSVLEQAAWLRGLARKIATSVILHVDSSNLVSSIAFGESGGPPVMLVNHAAHVFWVGASMPDLVLNCRGSRLEEYWTRVHRGVKNSATVPIPLPKPEAATLAQTDRDERRARAKEIIGVPKEAVLIMTSGASYKYKPLGRMDFLKTCREILEAVPEAYLLAAGVVEDDRWREVSNKVGFRLRALGGIPQKEIAQLHQAADIYIEGFPFGSTTALLEAGLQGIPLVLSPAECPPPYGSDGIALDEILERPSSVERYKLEVVRLCGNPSERTALGLKAQKAIMEHHTGDGWKRHLANAYRLLPPEHRLYPIQAPLRTPPEIYEYWRNFTEIFQETKGEKKSVLEQQIDCAYAYGLRPKITPRMKLACENARRFRAGGSIPLPLLLLLCNYCLPLLPLSPARAVLRIVKYLFRDGLPGRLRNKAIRRFRGNDDSQDPYKQYRRLQERFKWPVNADQAAFKEQLNRK